MIFEILSKNLLAISIPLFILSAIGCSVVLNNSKIFNIFIAPIVFIIHYNIYTLKSKLLQYKSPCFTDNRNIVTKVPKVNQDQKRNFKFLII